MGFAINYVCSILAIFVLGLLLLLPPAFQELMPIDLKIIFLLLAAGLTIVPTWLIQNRAKKTTVDKVLKGWKRGYLNWLYLERDGNAYFTDAFKEMEEQSYSPEVNAQAQHMKRYRLGDKSFIIVPEGIGQGIDVDYVVQAQCYRDKYGIHSIHELRQGVFGKRWKEIDTPMKFIEGEQSGELKKKIVSAGTPTKKFSFFRKQREEISEADISDVFRR